MRVPHHVLVPPLGGCGGWGMYPGGVEVLPLSSGSPSDWDVLLRNIANEIGCYTMTVTVAGASGTYSASVVRCE